MRPSTGQQVRLLLSVPWQWRRNESGPWALRIFAAVAALLLLVPAVAALVWMPPRHGAAVAGALVFLAVVLGWGLQVGVLLRLDHPHAAHTVPGHATALRLATVVLWLALAGGCGALAALAAGWLEGSALNWALLAVAGAATALFLLALAIRWWWLWVPLSLGPALMGVDVWRMGVLGGGRWLHQQWQVQPLSLTLALLVVQGLLLPMVFGRGDGHHARVYAGRDQLRKLTAAGAAGKQPALAAYGRWGEWLGLPWQGLADAWLARVCRRARATPRSAMDRAEVVLHGAQHWVRFLSTGLLVLGVVGLCLVATIRLSGVDLPVLLKGGHVGISIGLTIMALNAVMTLPAALWHSRREQALLVLLPGMPQGAALTRAVAWRQLRQYLWTWAVVLPALAAMVWAGQGLGLVAYAAMALPMSAWMWRDASRLREARPAAAFGPVLLCLLAGTLSAFLLSRVPGALLPWLLTVLAATVGLLVWRWQRMVVLPRALPAGRLA
jgi:hypothetical protein